MNRIFARIRGLQSTRPHIEPLEDRTLMSTCHVTRLTDQGIGMGFRGDLRYCINKVNDAPGPDNIDYKVTGTIQLTGALPELSTEMDILGPGPDSLTVRRNTGGNYRIFTVGTGADVRIVGMTMTNGRVENDIGGGILNHGTLTLENTRVTDNRASNQGFYADIRGGGIYNAGSLTISQSSVGYNYTYNQSGSGPEAWGGGVFNTGTLAVTESTFEWNQAYASGSYIGDAYGGAIANQGGVVTVIRSTFRKNGAGADGCELGGAGWGGAIWGTGSLTVVDSTIADNGAGGGGCGDTGFGVGAGISHGGNVSLINTTLTLNDTGGGCWCTGIDGIYATGTWTITHSTINDGLEVPNSATLTMRNTLLLSLDGHIDNSGYNLIFFTAAGSGYVPSDILGVNPLLGSLALNGGPTQTLALLPGSPAIDAGTNQMAPEWDQRGPGYPRIVNGTVDIGAFEVQATGVPTAPDFLALLITADFENDE